MQEQVRVFLEPETDYQIPFSTVKSSEPHYIWDAAPGMKVGETIKREHPYTDLKIVSINPNGSYNVVKA